MSDVSCNLLKEETVIIELDGLVLMWWMVVEDDDRHHLNEWHFPQARMGRTGDWLRTWLLQRTGLQQQ